MNEVILMGRITKDLELRYTQGTEPIAVLKFNIAVAGKFKKENENNADFINCVAFGKTAEFISKYFVKGKLIAIIGEIRVNHFEKDGAKLKSTEILVENVEFCGDRDSKKNDFSNFNTNDESFYSIEKNVEDDELPF